MSRCIRFFPAFGSGTCWSSRFGQRSAGSRSRTYGGWNLPRRKPSAADQKLASASASAQSRTTTSRMGALSGRQACGRWRRVARMTFTTRPATVGDAAAIYGLVAACERDLDGRAEVDLDDIVADLGRPALDLARDTLVVHDAAGTLP